MSAQPALGRNFIVGIKYNSLADLNGQDLAWAPEALLLALRPIHLLQQGQVVFLGPPDVGKTHLASALGLVAARHRFSTYYINCHQLIAKRHKKTSTIFTSK